MRTTIFAGCLPTRQWTHERVLAGADLSANVSTILEYLRDLFPHARFVDPANEDNVLSDTLAAKEKKAVSTAVQAALAMTRWREVVR